MKTNPAHLYVSYSIDGFTQLCGLRADPPRGALPE